MEWCAATSKSRCMSGRNSKKMNTPGKREDPRWIGKEDGNHKLHTWRRAHVEELIQMARPWCGAGSARDMLGAGTEVDGALQTSRGGYEGREDTTDKHEAVNIGDLEGRRSRFR